MIKPSILESPEVCSFMTANQNVIKANETVNNEEKSILKLTGIWEPLTSEQLQQAQTLVTIEEEQLRPFRSNLYRIMEHIPDLSRYAAAENYSPEEWAFRQENGRTHNFILATARYLDRSRQVDENLVDWAQFKQPAGFLPGKALGGAPNLLQEIQFRTSIKSPMLKRPELKTVAERNSAQYTNNPLYKYFIDQIFDAFDQANIPYDAFEFQNDREITKEHVIDYLKVVGKMLSNGYQSSYNSAMFSS